MKKDSSLLRNFLKFLFVTLAIVVALQIISRILGNRDLILGAILSSLGVLSIIWTLLARSNLSPKSQLRLIANNFLACSITVLTFSILITLNSVIEIKGIIYIEYILIFIMYFFFILVSYYIYTIGKEFGFQKESIEMGKHLEGIKKIKKSSMLLLSVLVVLILEQWLCTVP